ncbi:MAG: hypothetical protein U0230_07240 [Polyangiales bacterium]
MAEDVGTRAVRVGLATREQLAEALALSQRTGMPLVEALVCVGVPDDALEALFVAEGLAERLEGGLPEERRPDVLPGFGGAMALAFLALPLAREQGSVLVAMADPTDPHALAELAFRAAAPVTGRVARVGALREAILSTFPDARASIGSDLVEEPRSLLESTPDAVPARHRVAPREPAAEVVPASSPPVGPAARAEGVSEAKRPSELPPAVDSWGDLATAPPESDPSRAAPAQVAVPPGAARVRLERAPRGPTRLPEVGTFLAAMRVTEDRDRALALACEAALSVSRTAVFFALRKDTLRGHVARGAGLDDDGARLVELPAQSPTVLGRVLSQGRSHFGTYGTGAIDQMLRASLGSRGGWVSVHPVEIEGKVVGVLLGDEVRHGPLGDERVGLLAHAAGQAMRRIIAKARRP